jgi:deazaflavin-dependent oxidoreductase (nitroreductase family)
MPAPRWVARLNKRFTNRLLGPLTPFVPGFGVLIHVGRKSHRHYRTPVNVFRRPHGYVIALTYGPQSDWVQNVLASGTATLETRGRIVALHRPRLIHDEDRRLMPAPARLILAVGNISDFLELAEDDAGIA